MSADVTGPARERPSDTVRRWAAGVRWYVRELSGEAKWDDHLERCRRDGLEPMTRREFERHRSEALERNPQRRCC
ncbi:YbdD/YjiX family protein [uncultured Nocardioides sp.]|uniref:YbdD/YjiX family protein n=1 Tax=uncultured Nocardioides sp. TaxID=198441 RepID=UPI002636FD32|nr:YbdD/YjiX family protein [uncultured Nocardioides sp.]